MKTTYRALDNSNPLLESKPNKFLRDHTNPVASAQRLGRNAWILWAESTQDEQYRKVVRDILNRKVR